MKWKSSLTILLLISFLGMKAQPVISDEINDEEAININDSVIKLLMANEWQFTKQTTTYGSTEQVRDFSSYDFTLKYGKDSLLNTNDKWSKMGPKLINHSLLKIPGTFTGSNFNGAYGIKSISDTSLIFTKKEPSLGYARVRFYLIKNGLYDKKKDYTISEDYKKITFQTKTKFEIWDQNGKKLLEGKSTKANISKLPVGTYYIIINSKNETFKKLK